MQQLHSKIIGSGDPVVILHGLFGMLDNWMTFAKILSEQYTVFLVDLRNHGRSFNHPEHSYPLMAADVSRFMEDNHLFEGANVIGHSMGGKVAMQLALDCPHLVEKLVVIDMGIKVYQGGHDAIFNGLRAIDLPKMTSRTEVEHRVREFESDEGTVQFLLKNLGRTPETGEFEWKMNLEVLWDNYPNVLKPVEGLYQSFDEPTLFLRGGRSQYILDADWPGIFERFPQARLETIPDAGHWIHADQPDLLMKSLLNFF
jgi:esterase